MNEEMDRETRRKYKRLIRQLNRDIIIFGTLILVALYFSIFVMPKP